VMSKEILNRLPCLCGMKIASDHSVVGSCAVLQSIAQLDANTAGKVC
jgi:hypothetical protein